MTIRNKAIRAILLVIAGMVVVEGFVLIVSLFNPNASPKIAAPSTTISTLCKCVSTAIE